MSGIEEIKLGFSLVKISETPEEALRRLCAAGFDGIELWPDALHAWGVDRWAEALTATGMTCVQLCPYFDFVHGPEKIEESRHTLTEFLHAARTCGCTRIRTFTGPPWGVGVVGPHAASEAQWQTATASLQEFCDIAAGDGIELCLECHEGSLMENAPSALRLINSINRPNLTVNLQLPLVGEDWQTSVRLLGPDTTHIHIHNWTQDIGIGDITFLDAGAFDWRLVLNALPNRSVCLSVEHPDHGGRDEPWETARRDGAYLQALRQQVLETQPL